MCDIKKLLEELKNKLHYEIRQQGYNGEQLVFSYYAIPEENEKLANTPFYYNSENDFFHFTSLENFYSILNTGHLRLYNLNNMDDKFEFDYARKILKSPSLLKILKTPTHIPTTDNNNMTITVEMKRHNYLTDKNRQHLTGDIFYCRDSAGFSVSAFNKLMCNLTGKCFEIGNKNIPPIR